MRVEKLKRESNLRVNSEKSRCVPAYLITCIRAAPHSVIKRVNRDFRSPYSPEWPLYHIDHLIDD
jgi:Uri superfamily endonuclease